jgi:hypothetical protein
MNTKILLAGIEIAAVAGFGIFKGLSLSETASNIRVSLASVPKIHKIDLTGLKVSVDLRVDNPSKERITVKIPSVRLSYKGKLLASTAINDKVYFRVNKYDINRDFSHVYVIVPRKDSGYYVMDTVIKTFDKEKPVAGKEDYLMDGRLSGFNGLNGIPIQMLNGASPSPLGGGWGGACMTSMVCTAI